VWSFVVLALFHSPDLGQDHKGPRQDHAFLWSSIFFILLNLKIKNTKGPRDHRGSPLKTTREGWFADEFDEGNDEERPNDWTQRRER